MKKYFEEQEDIIISKEKVAVIDLGDVTTALVEHIEAQCVEMPKGTQNQLMTFNFSDGQSVTCAISVNWKHNLPSIFKCYTGFHFPICSMLDSIAFVANEHSLNDIISAVSGQKIRKVTSEWVTFLDYPNAPINEQFAEAVAELLGINDDNSYGDGATIELANVFLVEIVDEN